MAASADGALLAVPAFHYPHSEPNQEVPWQAFVYLFDSATARGTVEESSAVAVVAGAPWGEGCEPCGDAAEQALVLGDVTRDGVDDLALSGTMYTQQEPYDAGMSWLVPGFGSGGEFDIDESDRLIEDTFPRMDSFGRSMEIADINGDGVGDLLVTEPRYSEEAEWGDRLYVFAGPITSIPFAEPHITIDGGGIDPSNDLYFGRELAIGDVTGDGYADVAASADDDEELYLFAGPVETGTHDDALAVIGADGQYIPESLDIAAAGDSTLTGHLVIGDGRAGDAGEGAVYVVPAPFAPRTELTLADATFLGEPGSHVGMTVGSLGDADGDGEIDVVARGYDDNARDSLWFLYSSGR